MYIFFDLDKILINVDYQYTDKGIQDVVRRAVEQDYVVGLNSEAVELLKFFT